MLVRNTAAGNKLGAQACRLHHKPNELGLLSADGLLQVSRSNASKTTCGSHMMGPTSLSAFLRLYSSSELSSSSVDSCLRFFSFFFFFSFRSLFPIVQSQAWQSVQGAILVSSPLD